LILCMMWEDAQGARSKWYGYLRELRKTSFGQSRNSGFRIGTLPERFDTPMFWSEDDLKWLQGTDLLSKFRVRLLKFY
jgi:SET domain-containing protein 6